MLLANWFCFVQTEDGKVVAVHHSPTESQNTVDFKRSIAAAFQANFKGTTEEMESDPQSNHMAYYRYLAIECLFIGNVQLAPLATF